MNRMMKRMFAGFFCLMFAGSALAVTYTSDGNLSDKELVAGADVEIYDNAG